ncbi:MAG: DNA repair protein RadC, partial [Lachnospiraceae bacterium]
GLVKHTKGQGIIGLQRLSVGELAKLPGIGRVKAVQLKSICELSRRMARQSRQSAPRFTSSAEVVEYLMEDMRHLPQEHLKLLLLDTKCKLIHEETISIGTVNSTIMSPREICRMALIHDCTGIILAHNHPTGDPSPSKEDVLATGRIAKAAELIGISLIDHIIIGDNTYISMKDNSMIQW